MRFHQLFRTRPKLAIALIIAFSMLILGSALVVARSLLLPQTDTVANFTGYRLPWAPSESWTVTCKGQCSGRNPNFPRHENQIDFDVIGANIITGTVYASKPGRIIFVKESSSSTDPHTDGYQNLVVIEHKPYVSSSDPGEYSWYAHLAHNEVYVEVGDIVGYGTKIGMEGDTGPVSGVHLHFMVSTNIPDNFYDYDPDDIGRAPWPRSNTIVAVNFYERSWANLSGSPTSQNGAPGSCNGYIPNGIALFKHADCVGPAVLLDTIGKHTLYEYPDWEEPGTSLNDKISSIAVKDGLWLHLFKDNNGLNGLGPNRRLIGSDVFDRNKWDLSKDWYDTGRQYSMNDSISFFECGKCGAAAAVNGPKTANSTCPAATPPASTPPPQPTVTTPPPPPPTATPQPSASWNVRFYSSVNECSQANCNPGSVYLNRSVTGQSLDLTFGDGRAFGTGGTTWGSIWQQTINFAPGQYIFHSDHDDGVKLFINGINIMDVGPAENNNRTCPARSLSGSVPVTIIWKNTGGAAKLRLWWDTNTSACANPIPVAPSNLRQTGSTQATNSIAWNDNSGNESGFRVYRWDGVNFVQFAWLGSNVTSFTDTSVSCGIGYFYKIAAYNADGESGQSNMLTAYAQACAPQAPTPPTNLQVLNSYLDGVSLYWNDNSSNEVGFRVYWTEGTDEILTTVGPNTTNFFLERPCGWTGTVSVAAYDYDHLENLVRSGPVSASTTACPVVTPSNFRINWVSERSVNLSWNDNSGNESGFKIYRWNGTLGDWQLRATAAANATQWEDYPVSSNTTYFYHITAFNSNGESNEWVSLEATTHPLPPLVARNLRTVYAGKDYIALTWDDMSTDEGGFMISRFNPDYTLNTVAGQNGPDTVGFVDTGLTCGTEYIYAVNAFNITGGYYGDFLFVSTSPCAAPNPPYDARQISTRSGVIGIQWEDMSSNEEGFKVYRWNGVIGNWELYGTQDPNNNLFIDTNVVCGQGYAYKVSTFIGENEAFAPGWVETNGGSCTPEAPSNLTGIGSSQTSVTLSWDDNSNIEDVFNVWRWNGVTLTWDWYDHVNANITQYTDTDLVCGTTYFYYITAYKDADSEPSDWISATTAQCSTTKHLIFIPFVTR